MSDTAIAEVMVILIEQSRYTVYYLAAMKQQLSSAVKQL